MSLDEQVDEMMNQTAKVLDRGLGIVENVLPKYAQLVYNGFWFSPEREMLQNAIDEAQKRVTGTARLKLYKGNCIVAGRKAPRSLYVPDLATFERDEMYEQGDATGFIRLNALRLKVRSIVDR